MKPQYFLNPRTTARPLAKIVPGILVALSIFACTHTSKDKKTTEYTPSPSEVTFTVMTYNVENLFDLKDDPSKDDNTFLPLSQKKSKRHIDNCNKIEVAKWKDQCLNWNYSQDVLETKLERLGKVIRAGNFNRGPDILMFQEVENLAVLTQLRDKHLSDLGYKTIVLIEGKDKRGIDVAFMSRFKLIGSPKLHDITFEGVEKKRVQDTRGILEATFELPDLSPLTAYSVHFPAPFHPAPMRVQAFKKLNELVTNLPPGRLHIAGGDFNLTSEEDARDKVLDSLVKAHWQVAHQLGCKGCKGTNYYPPKNSWSFLDMILISKNFDSSMWKLRDVRIHNTLPFQNTSNFEPNDFKLPEIEGVSDHWPLQVTFGQLPSTH